MDSTGIKFLGEREWKRKKHWAEYRRQWRKVHLGIDANTLGIRAIEVTDNSVGDAPMLPELLGQIPPDEPIASVSADGAYDTKARHLEEVERLPTAAVWWRPRCIASSAWASGSWREQRCPWLQLHSCIAASGVGASRVQLDLCNKADPR